MSELHDIMEVLVASWLLSADERDDAAAAIPTSHGVLDRALQAALAKGVYGQWRNAVHFVDSRIGLQCLELPQILTLAQRSELTASPNPSYQTARIKVSSTVAERLLYRLGVSVEEAKKWGNQLRQEVAAVQSALLEYPAASSA
jgi:hypothetical protein